MMKAQMIGSNFKALTGRLVEAPSYSMIQSINEFEYWEYLVKN